MKLSKNFILGEVIKLVIVIKYGIDNKFIGEYLFNLIEVVNKVFQFFRDYFRRLIAVISGYCSEVFNKCIGGSFMSQYCKGEVLDLDADVFSNFENWEVFEYIKNELVFDQFIWEFGDEENLVWVYVSYKCFGNRGEVFKAVKQGGKIIYKRW